MNTNNAHISLFSILLILTAFISGCGMDKSAAENRIPVITVGGASITLGEFKDRLEDIYPEDSDTKTMESEYTELKMNLVNRIIEEQVILRESLRLRVNITESDVDGEMMKIREDLGEEVYKEIILTKFGNVDKWKVELKRELTIKEAINRAVHSRISISDAGARQYYDENEELFNTPPQVRASMIIVDSKKKANELLNKIKKGEDFAKLATKHSTGNEAHAGGDLGFFSKGDMPEEFENSVMALKIGQVSDVVETTYGFHIFMLTDKNKGSSMNFEQAKEAIKEDLKMRLADRHYHKWILDLKKRTRITVNEEAILAI